MIKRNKNKWFAHQTSNPEAKLNLLCFVFAGGSPSFFAPWKTIFPSTVNLMPVLYPGRESRAAEILPDTMEELVETFSKESGGVMEKPYAIWGHCSGALLGFKLAMAQTAADNPPAAFIVSGCEAPQYALRLIPEVRDDFSEVKDEDILKSLSAYGLMPQDMIENPVFRNYFLPIYRRDLEMFSKYRHKSSTLGCRALIMNGTEDHMLKQEYIDKWNDCFDSAPTFLSFSGKHYFVNDHKEEVAKKILDFCFEGRYIE